MSSWILPLIATIVFYGLAQALTKQLMANMTASAFIILYVLCKMVINVGAYLALGQHSVFQADIRPFFIWAAASNVFNAMAWLFYYKALEKGPVSVVGTVVAAFPVLTVLLSWPILGEKLAWFQYIGVALAIAGGILVSYQPDSGDAPAERGSGWLVSALLVFLFWGITMVVIKLAYRHEPYDDYVFLISNTLMVTLILGPYGLATLKGGLGSRRDVLLALIPTALFCLGDVALFKATASGPVSIVTPLQGSYPLITILYAVLFMRERMLGYQQGGLGIIMGAILLISMVADPATHKLPMGILALSLACVAVGAALLLRHLTRGPSLAPAPASAHSIAETDHLAP